MPQWVAVMLVLILVPAAVVSGVLAALVWFVRQMEKAEED